MDTFKAAVILLVEDDPGDQKLIEKSLTSEKIINQLRIVNTGEEAMQYLNRSKAGDNETPIPDLILLDLNMPGMGGREFLKLMKSQDRFDTIPVVILTTSDSDRDILESFKLQAAGYIKKPVTLDQFQELMHNLTEYWFVICRRVCHGNEYKYETDRCFVS